MWWGWALLFLTATAARAIESLPCEPPPYFADCVDGIIYVDHPWTSAQPGDQLSLRWCWEPTTGNPGPDGYDIEVSRDGSAYEALGSVAVNQMEIPGWEGDTYRVRYKAWNQIEHTDYSPESCPVHVDPLGPPGFSWFEP